MSSYRPSGFGILPPVVKNILIINVIMVVAQFVLGQRGIDLADYLGLHYWESSYFKPWQLLTHIFMHGAYNDLNATFLHLFSNMFALWMFGSVLENRWGPKRFLAFYLICGVGAALCHLTVLHFEFSAIIDAFDKYQQNPSLDAYLRFIKEQTGSHNSRWLGPVYNLAGLWSSDPSNVSYQNESLRLLHSYLNGNQVAGLGRVDGIMDVATVGASGAVFGILFAFGYLFPNVELYIYFLIPFKAKYFVAMYALFELFAGIRNSAGDNVAHFAHLGGMLFAWFILLYWQRSRRHLL